MDHVGILARSVEDTAIVLQVLAGYDSKDPYSLNQPVPDYFLSSHSEEAPHIGLLQEYFFDHADDEMRSHTVEVAEHLRRAGAKVETVALPLGFDTIGETNRIIMSVEAAAYHQEAFASHREQYGTKIGEMIERGLATSATEYAEALQSRLHQRVEMQTLLNRVDALLTPGAPGTAPRDLTTTGNPVMQVPWSTLGLPTIGIPICLGQNGLPLGIQLVGLSLAEQQLLKAARWCERVLDVHLQPPKDWHK
jgi:aspartyl-tRNA(Asn)/glutamyl-tRNA(Gln) amidotransferase subunit A